MARQFLNGVNLVNQLVTAIGAQMNTNKLLGRSTASAGAIEEITIGSGLSLTGGTLSATGGGGGLTHFAESESTASPNATVPVDALTATDASYTNIDVALVTKGSGATLAQVPDATATGGDKRGTNATDWQKVRSSATQVASGSRSTISGGANNTASGSRAAVVGGDTNTASNTYSFVGCGQANSASIAHSFVGGGQSNTASTNTHATVCGGFTNTASGQYSFVGGGQSNTASGGRATVAGGQGNAASGSHSFIGGGESNTANNFYAAISGGFGHTADGNRSFIGGGARGTTRGITGNHVFPACNIPISFTQGVTQSAILLLARETTDATATVLTSDTSAAAATNQVTLPNNSAYSFSGEVIAGVTSGGNTARWTINGAIKRGANAASTAMVGTATVTMSHFDVGAAAWVVAVTADTTNGGIAVTVTGAAATTIRWVAKINTTEMTY